VIRGLVTDLVCVDNFLRIIIIIIIIIVIVAASAHGEQLSLDVRGQTICCAADRREAKPRSSHGVCFAEHMLRMF
jgi:hypothetical protein